MQGARSRDAASRWRSRSALACVASALDLTPPDTRVRRHRRVALRPHALRSVSLAGGHRQRPTCVAWFHAQNDYTRSILDALPGRAALYRRLMRVEAATRTCATCRPPATCSSTLKRAPDEATFQPVSARRHQRHGAAAASIPRDTTATARPQRSNISPSRPTASGWRSAWPWAAPRTRRCTFSTSRRARRSARPFRARAARIRRGATTAKSSSTRSSASAHRRRTGCRPDARQPRLHANVCAGRNRGRRRDLRAAASIRRSPSTPTTRRRSMSRRYRRSPSASSATACRTRSRCTSRR